MAKVRSFDLQPGTRIGNYRTIANIGRGWEAEVYKVAEVPTGAVRALKLFRTDDLDSIRHLLHFAWYYEQVRRTGHFPVYYHYGQWFFDDDNGCWFLILEFISGRPLHAVVKSGCAKEEKEALYFQLASAVADVHEFGYAVGDFDTLENVFLTEGGGIVFVDCIAGEPDRPYSDFRLDCKKELIAAAARMFGRKIPPAVKALVKMIDDTGTFRKGTLRMLLHNIGH